MAPLTALRQPTAFKFSNLSLDAFATQHKRAFRHCGLDTTKYRSHSFHIGAASHAAEVGSWEIELIFKIFALFYSVNSGDKSRGKEGGGGCPQNVCTSLI